MQIPETFPEGTIFLDVEGTPVTAHFLEGRYFDWEDRDAAERRPVNFEEIRGRGEAITESEFRALVRRAHSRALPALLVRAAKDLMQRERDHAELKAQGLSGQEIGAEMRARAERRRAEEPETLALRTIAAAQRSARRDP